MRSFGFYISKDWQWRTQNQRNLVFALYTFTLMIFMTTTTQAQVVINEIFPNGSVELKNIGNSTVNIGSY